MYVFWRGCMETEKDRSSTFDVYVLSLIFAVSAGRLGYILSNLDEFTGFIWYWSPYEKYADTVYLFRLLPWRFLRIWDGGVAIPALFVGFILFATFFVLFVKKWRWRQLFFVVFFSGVLMLSSSLLYVSAISSDLSILLFSGILFASIAVFYISSHVITRLKVKWRVRKKIVGYIGSILIWLVSAYISYKFLVEDNSMVEKISAYVLIAWVVISTILFVVDMRKKKAKIEKVSSVQSVSLPEVNQPIRLPVDEKKK
jgi:hypothetical protein